MSPNTTHFLGEMRFKLSMQEDRLKEVTRDYIRDNKRIQRDSVIQCMTKIELLKQLIKEIQQ